ncbi:MAG: glycosyltransferase family 9 protein [bacterium]
MIVPEPAKILIIQLRRIGDVLLTTPAVEVLKRHFPGAGIDFMAERPSDQLLRRNPWIRKVLVYDEKSPLGWISAVRRERYDWVIDFLSTPRSAFIAALSGAKVRAGPGYTSMRWVYNVRFRRDEDEDKYTAFKKIDRLRTLGVENSPHIRPFLSLTDRASDYCADVFRRLGFAEGDRVIGFAPASRKITRQWLPEYYAELGKAACEKLGAKILIFWGPGERGLAEKIAADISPLADRAPFGEPPVGSAALARLPAVGQAAPGAVPGLRRGLARAAPETADLDELAALISGVRLLVSNCNGPRHMATALGVRTLGIYGSSNPGSWTPPGDPRHRTVRAEGLECLGCGLNKCPEDLECMRNLRPETVFKALEEMLKKW